MGDDDNVVFSIGPGGKALDARERGEPRGANRSQRRGAPAQADPSDGVARVRRETKGRGGKTVTVIAGLALPDGDVKALAKELRHACGSGGSCKAGVIEIQGDHTERVLAELAERGLRAKRAGG